MGVGDGIRVGVTVGVRVTVGSGLNGVPDGLGFDRAVTVAGLRVSVGGGGVYVAGDSPGGLHPTKSSPRMILATPRRRSSLNIFCLRVPEIGFFIPSKDDHPPSQFPGEHISVRAIDFF